MANLPTDYKNEILDLFEQLRQAETEKLHSESTFQQLKNIAKDSSGYSSCNTRKSISNTSIKTTSSTNEKLSTKYSSASKTSVLSNKSNKSKVSTISSTCYAGCNRLVMERIETFANSTRNIDHLTNTNTGSLKFLKKLGRSNTKKSFADPNLQHFQSELNSLQENVQMKPNAT